MHKYKRPSVQRAITRWVWSRKLALFTLLLAMACWSRLDRAVMREDLAALETRIASTPTPKGNDDAPATTDPITVRAVGGSGVVLQGRGILRAGDTLDGWDVESVAGGAATLRRGDARAQLRSGSVFDPASGAVTR